jgi:DNA-binding XRE family transcriptional regulator
MMVKTCRRAAFPCALGLPLASMYGKRATGQFVVKYLVFFLSEIPIRKKGENILIDKYMLTLVLALSLIIPTFTMFVDSPNQQVAYRIKQLRLTKQLPQKYMAHMLDISQAAYCDLENGITEIRVNILVKIAQVFEVSAVELIDGTAPPRMIWDKQLTQKPKNSGLSA